DQFTFPLMYAQIAEDKRTDVVALDQELLRRSWYLNDLEREHPALIAGSRRQVDAFLAAVRPFEAGKPAATDDAAGRAAVAAGRAYDGAALDTAYFAMIKSFVDQYERAGRDVYFTFQPDAQVVRGYSGESVGVALKARRTAPGKSPAALRRWLTPVDPAGFDFAHLTDGTVPLDRNATMVRSWYADTLAARAQLLQEAGETGQAQELAAQAQALAGG
ncbi:MAG TPA: hypothetical protein VK576_08155, partial [Thermoleophilia bacterium]|nr:hypothetical protein [Thermoleophilia bacterium]